MDDLFGSRLAELLTARLCHELVSPIGAISNGVELLEEEPDFAAEATQLIAQSARQAAWRLQFYRIAYGSITPIADDKAREATLALFAEGKIECDWPASLPPLPEGRAKLACNLMLLGAEALPRGGKVSLALVTTPRGDVMAVAAAGLGARVNDPIPALLAGTGALDDLTARTVHAGFTASVAAQHGSRIRLDQERPDEVTLVVMPL